ncbi:unnamed protein product [Moneuplotes crassus]|uniref:Uncharacterized protein n=1 Tax=Euplotes crassus TaxID=5936 RepID=A0AAD2D8T9_EUPCR|nr:unnamed protein product [Moneuplotes crassus]
MIHSPILRYKAQSYMQLGKLNWERINLAEIIYYFRCCKRSCEGNDNSRILLRLD